MVFLKYHSCWSDVIIMDLMFMSSPKNHILKPQLPVAVFGDIASKEVIKGHESGALIQKD